MSTSDCVIIRQLEASDSIEELTELLHRSYKVLADQGLKYLATYQSPDVTRRRVQKGTCYVAVLDKHLVGTITYHPPGMQEGSPWIERPDVAHMGQLGVEPNLRHRRIGRRLLEQAEANARADGAVEICLDTAKPAQQLIAWYGRLGYRTIEQVSWDITNYTSVIMSKKL